MVGGVRLGWPASASLLTGFTASLLVHLYPLSGEDLRVRMLPCKVLQGGFTLCKPKHRSAGVCVALWPSPVLPAIPIGGGEIPWVCWHPYAWRSQWISLCCRQARPPGFRASNNNNNTTAPGWAAK